MNIIFMGTPDFAVPTLQVLVQSQHTVSAVFCQPDKPVGRKHIITPPPVKQYAVSQNIPVYQPQRLKDDGVEDIIKNINPDVIVVVAYGKILPENILRIPKNGCINGHGSLLPKYRGASPIQWAIVNGETETGVTAMYMDVGMDTGDMLNKTVVKIGEEETAEQLFNRLAPICAETIMQTLCDIENGNVNPVKQNEDDATYAPIITKEMALINFAKSAAEIVNAVRGYNSWPIAYFMLDGKRLKVFKCKIGSETKAEPGTVIASDNVLSIAAGDNKSVDILEVQLEGSKQMGVAEMLKGKKIPVNTRV